MTLQQKNRSIQKPSPNSLKEEMKDVFAPSPVDIENLHPKPVKRKDNIEFFTGASPKFFILTKAVKKKRKNRVSVPVNLKVIHYAKRIEKKFLGKTQDNLELMRNFLVQKIAPRLLPVISSIDEARDVLKEVMGVDVNSTSYSVFVKYMTVASEVKIASFITSYLRLDKEEQRKFYERLESDKLSEDMFKLQKMGSVPGQAQGIGGLQLPTIRALAKILKKRG